MDRRGAKIIYLSIFRNNLLNIRTGFNDFLLLNAYLCDLKLAARILLDLGIYAAGNNKVTRSDAPTVKL